MTRTKWTNSWMIGLICSVGLPWIALADPAEWNTNAENVVLDGYDVVAYHNEDRAVRGAVGFSIEHDGAEFRFSSQEHLDLFRQNPARYAPKFGGFCAFGVGAKKAKAPTNPETFKVYNGELLLFFNDVHEGQTVNTKVMWNQDESSLYDRAVSNWKSLR